MDTSVHRLVRFEGMVRRAIRILLLVVYRNSYIVDPQRADPMGEYVCDEVTQYLLCPIHTFLGRVSSRVICVVPVKALRRLLI